MKIMAGSRLGKGKCVSGKMQKEASSRDSHLSHQKARPERCDSDQASSPIAEKARAGPIK